MVYRLSSEFKPRIIRLFDPLSADDKLFVSSLTILPPKREGAASYPPTLEILLD